MKHHKKNSKKTKCSKAHKIEKKCREHKRKMKKEAKKLKKQGVLKVKKKHPKVNVPSLWPHKENELQMVEETIDRREQAQIDKRAAEAHAQRVKSKEAKKKRAANNSQSQGVVADILHSCDLIVEVLDARDPRICRSQQLEEFGSLPKLLILTKCDQVTIPHLQSWVTYLRKDFPTACIAFPEGKKPLGMHTVIKMIKGFKATKIAIAGYESCAEKIKLGMMLRNSNWERGIKFEEVTIQVSNDADDTDNSLCHQPQSSRNPTGALQTIIKRSTQESIRLHLTLPAFNDTIELLTHWSGEKKMEIQDAARSLLKTFNAKEWQANVPELNTRKEGAPIQPQIENIEAFYAEEMKIFTDARAEKNILAKPLQLTTDGFYGPKSDTLDNLEVYQQLLEKDEDMVSDDDEEEDDDEDMESDEEEDDDEMDDDDDDKEDDAEMK